MCLAVPGKLVRWIERDTPFARAEVEFDGVRRECNLACVPEAEAGDYVLVHAGIAINRLDADAALKLIEDLRSLPEDA